MSPQAPLDHDSFPDLPCFWWPWVWELLVRYSADWPLSFVLFDVFLMITGVKGFLGQGGRETQRKSTIIIADHGHIVSAWLITVDVDLDHLAEEVFVRFLHSDITLSCLHTALLKKRFFIIIPLGFVWLLAFYTSSSFPSVGNWISV